MRAKERGDKSTIPRLVWTLTAVGVGAGVVMLAIVNYALARVRDERARTESLQTGLTTAVAALREEREAVFADLEARFSVDAADDRAAARSPDSLIPMVRQCQQRFGELASGGPTAAVATAELVRSFKSLSAIHEISEQWECETQQVRGDWNAARKRARMAIREATATAQKIEGRARLQRAAILRRYHRADKQEANALAVTIVDQLGSDRGLVTLKAELSDLALLCERLAGEREIDDLVSLKDGFSLESPAGRLHARILASVAEYENEVRRERVLAGQEAARRRGKTWGGSEKGWRWKVTDDQVTAIHEMRAAGKPIAQIARVTALSRPTIYRVLRELEPVEAV
ncbi:MAG: recombinase family protein [Planctomycetes bacterium]|nr:recombinase family protein [Planctomycetota bacterium]